MRAGCVAYVNTDEVAFGPTFFAAATPDLADMLRDASSDVSAPGNGEPLSAYWQKQDAKREVSPIGSGSDHEPFVYRQNIPAAQGAFGGPFGTYHSAYDDPASLTLLDPGMHEAAAAARFTSIVVLRLADAIYPDLRLATLATTLSARIVDFAKAKGEDSRRAAVVAALTPDADAFVKAAATLDAEATDDVTRGDTAGAAALYARLRAAENAFYQPSATSWVRTLLYDLHGESGVLPSLDATLASDGGDAALSTLRAAFEAATAAATPPSVSR